MPAKKITPNKRSARYVMCISNDGFPAALELRKVYRTVPDSGAAKHKLLRVIDESKEDYLFPENCFVPIELPRAAKALFTEMAS